MGSIIVKATLAALVIELRSIEWNNLLMLEIGEIFRFEMQI
jgi:hypothetical protein